MIFLQLTNAADPTLPVFVRHEFIIGMTPSNDHRSAKTDILTQAARLFVMESAEQIFGAIKRAIELEGRDDVSIVRCPPEAKVIDWPEPFEDTEAVTVSPQECVMALLLVGDVYFTFAELVDWSPEQRMEAYQWATIEHIHASDNDGLERLPRPKFIRDKSAGELDVFQIGKDMDNYTNAVANARPATRDDGSGIF